MKQNKIKKGFTLAEVLITLSILGVVAAVTVPSIHRKFQERIQMTGFKTAYSIFDEAFRMAVLENGDVRSWFNSTDPKEDTVAEKLRNYIKVTRYCGSSNKNSCDFYNNSTSTVYISDLKGNKVVDITNNNYERGRMILANGMFASIKIGNYQGGYWGNPSPKTGYASGYGLVKVDINGKKGPNRVGYDIFALWFNDKGLVATPSESYYWSNNSNSSDCYRRKCSITSSESPSDILHANGNTCSLWILMHNNMDYKRRDVSSEW